MGGFFGTVFENCWSDAAFTYSDAVSQIGKWIGRQRPVQGPAVSQ